MPLAAHNTTNPEQHMTEKKQLKYQNGQKYQFARMISKWLGNI